MQITSLTWILTLVLIGSDILLYYINSRPIRNNTPDTHSFDKHVQGDLIALWRRI